MHAYTVRTTQDGQNWVPYAGDTAGAIVFPANKDTESIVHNILWDPPVASALRIRPRAFHRRQALRWELISTTIGHPIGLEVLEESRGYKMQISDVLDRNFQSIVQCHCDLESVFEKYEIFQALQVGWEKGFPTMKSSCYLLMPISILFSHLLSAAPCPTDCEALIHI